jgi:uncharacterized membrane protein
VPSDEQRFESRATDRLMTFSDAVVAIAITLLALDLPVPTGNTMFGFWSSLRHDDGRYVSFLISFGVIAAAWSHHHEVFRYVDRIDSRLRTFDLFWLLLIVLIPFATKLLTVKGSGALGPHALRFGFYALLQVLISAALLSMAHYVTSRGLQATDAPPLAGTDADWQTYGLMLGFGLSIPAFFVTTYAWALWFLVPLLVRQLRRLQHRSHRSTA